ncbi:MAG TPA: molybdopterin converting factor subunit 1 [Chloroflexi bacterium]|nr:molybdopterin converting factor subunit 1 [Chloroflexota bacterium]
MSIRVLFFATLRDRAGVRETTLDLPDGTTVAALKELLVESYPRLRESLPTTIVAINREYAFDESRIEDGDEVALFPPVSGGSSPGPTLLKLEGAPPDLNQLLEAITLPTTGAACLFTGMVRAHTRRDGERDTVRLDYEAYRPMALAKLEQVAAEIRERWPEIEGVAIVQRLGTLETGSPTVVVACSSAHRDMGIFEAARYGIDRLKEIVPIWKREVGPQGEEWVEGDYHPTPEDRRAPS